MQHRFFEGCILLLLSAGLLPGCATTTYPSGAFEQKNVLLADLDSMSRNAEEEQWRLENPGHTVIYAPPPPPDFYEPYAPQESVPPPKAAAKRSVPVAAAPKTKDKTPSAAINKQMSAKTKAMLEQAISCEAISPDFEEVGLYMGKMGRPDKDDYRFELPSSFSVFGLTSNTVAVVRNAPAQNVHSYEAVFQLPLETVANAAALPPVSTGAGSGGEADVQYMRNLLVRTRAGIKDAQLKAYRSGQYVHLGCFVAPEAG